MPPPFIDAGLSGKFSDLSIATILEPSILMAPFVMISLSGFIVTMVMSLINVIGGACLFYKGEWMQ